MITRRQFTGGLLASTLAGSLGCETDRTNRRPNVLFVMGDEWRAQALGYAGDPNAHTPTIDRFAAQSMNFVNAVAGCSVCAPARASLLTGQYPLTHGVYINDVPLRPDGPTLAEVFRDAGYNTGYIGKWHLLGSPDGRYGRRDVYIPEDRRLGFEYWKAAEVSHDYNQSFYYEGADRTRKYWDGYDALAQTEDACQFVRDRSESENPYFLVLSWGPPHFPLHTAPERYRESYRDRDIVLRPNVPEEHVEIATSDLRGYYAHIAALDDCFAQLLAVLEETGTADDTIVLFTSDHGDMMESHGLKYKLYPWDESVCVPLLIRSPRHPEWQGATSAATIDSPDIMPTLLGLCGIPVPSSVEGTDFSQLLTAADESVAPESSFLSLAVPITSARTYGFAEYRGVRTNRHTYVRSISGPWLLYDNHEDPYQMKNLCNSAEHAETQQKLEVELSRWLDRLQDDFRPGVSYLREDNLEHFLETQFPVGHVESPWGDWESTLPRVPGPLSTESALGELLGIRAAVAILEVELPELTDDPMWWWRSLSPRLMQQFGYIDVTDSKLRALDEKLGSIPR